MDRIPEEKKGQHLKRKIFDRIEELVAPGVARWIILGVSSIIATTLLTFGTNPAVIPDYELGVVADRTLRATKEYEIIDVEETQRRKSTAVREVRNIYGSDPQMVNDAADRVARAFAAARTRGTGTPSERFAEVFDGEIGETTTELLARDRFSQSTEQNVRALLVALKGVHVVARKDLLGDKGITVVNMRDTSAPELVLDRTKVQEVDDVPTILASRGPELIPNASSRQVELATAVASASVRPNLTFDARETEKRRDRAQAAVSNVYIRVPQGKIIVEEGHVVTADQLMILAEIRKDSGAPSRNRARWVGLLILCAGVFGGMYFFGSRFTRVVPRSPKDLAVLASLILIGLFLARFTAQIAALQGAGSGIPTEAFPYVVPITMIAMVAALLFDAQIAAFVAVTAALLAGQMFEGSLAATTSYFLGSIAAAGALEQPTKRLDVFKAGFAAAGATVAVVAAYALTSVTPVSGQIVAWQIAFGLIAGLVASILAIGLVPAFEALGYVTNFRLQELGSLNNPLLRELNLRAPGTYNHSVIVGTLAEAAAESIHANPLFARVACYYHDIGKMRKPLYFIENQGGGENRHDKLSASMSALIVQAHVKDGFEMAITSGLPRPIADIIPQHHGTRLISFFYRKAREAAEDAGQDPDTILETDFRYDGPKPQTREAGIIMLADGSEAATRSIQDPTPAKIEGMIRRVLNMVWVDGQLDECDLTLRDLGLIAGSFKKSLLAIHHHRVAYPETKDISGKKKDKGDKGDSGDKDVPSAPPPQPPIEIQDRQGRREMVSADFSVIPLPREPAKPKTADKKKRGGGSGGK